MNRLKEQSIYGYLILLRAVNSIESSSIVVMPSHVRDVPCRNTASRKRDH